MANGKVKGGNYEREISKNLSLWLSGGENDDLFWRTQNSGGRYTTRYKKKLTLEGQSGDIASVRGNISNEFLKTFCVEIKFYKDINIWGFITKAKDGVLDFWKQAYEQSKQAGREPILIVKQNYKPALLISNKIFNKILIKNFKLKPELEVNLLRQKIFIWKLEDILDIDPKKFMSIITK